MPQVITLGTALLDEFCWELDATADIEGLSSATWTGRPREVRIGGGGVYAALGARIWLPPSQVGCIIHRGPDFPEELQKQLDMYGEEMWQVVDWETPTPRSLNTYQLPSPTRHFQLLIPPPPLLPSSFPSSRWSNPGYIHACCTPIQLSSILSSCKNGEKVVYEPIPPSCLPTSLPFLVPLLAHPAFFALSPNHLEAASLLDLSTSTVGNREGVEEVGKKLGEMGARRVVIRCGEWGSYWLEGGEDGWVEAFHEKGNERVRDTVGAGNAFLGGLLASLSLSSSLRCSTELEHQPNLGEHILRASVSASFIVEQLGFPLLSISEGGKVEERWNDEKAEERLDNLRRRVFKAQNDLS